STCVVASDTPTTDACILSLHDALPIFRLRADAAELAAATVAGGPPTELGGLPELKAAQARLDELLTEVQQTGAELKGLAPLLLRSEEHTSELQSRENLVCRLLLEKKKQ